MGSDGLRELIPLSGSSYCKTAYSHAFIGLTEETERQLPCVRSLRLIKEDRYGGLA